MAQFIDRRLNGKNKSAVNRQRFMRRYKEQIKESVADAVNRRSITNTETGEDVAIPHKDIKEPLFHQGKGGGYENVSILAMTSSLPAIKSKDPKVAKEAVALETVMPVPMAKGKTISFSKFPKMST